MELTSLGTEPMKVLVEENRLRVADVLLVRHKRSLLAWIIRAYSRSYWNHAALVYLVTAEDGFRNTFIIESAGQGIVLHKIDHYLRHPQKYDIGIKRLATTWHGSGNTELGRDFARRVTDYSLQALDSKYGWNIIAVIAMIAVGRIMVKIRFLPVVALLWTLFLSRTSYYRVAQGLLFAGASLQKGTALGLRKLAQIRWTQRLDRSQRVIWASGWLEQPIPYTPTRKGRPKVALPSGLEVNRYICSGFVQWAYFYVMKSYLDHLKGEPSMNLSQVVFNPFLDIQNPQEEVLLFTTPADIARSPNLSWRYIVKDGLVWQLSGVDQQEEIATSILKFI